METDSSIEKSQTRRSLLADLILVLVIAGLLVAILNVANEWKAPFRAETQIDLSFWKLPQYTLYSLARGWAAMLLSLVFAILYGTWAYYDRKARTVLLPALDILQSIPVLGFMPGLVLALVALFPKSNFGLELACVLMIFTAQVWNMVFSYYDSLKGVPEDLRQMGTLCGFGPLQRFVSIELPFAAQGLIYNCMVSMAGGWFFLTINEAFTLGDKNFQLPGLGSYMSVAISRGDVSAQVAAVVAMGVMIITMDRLVWWPLVIWSRKFKIEDVAGGPLQTTFVQRMLTAARLPRAMMSVGQILKQFTGRLASSSVRANSPPGPPAERSFKAIYVVLLAGVVALGAYGLHGLAHLIAEVDLREWILIVLSTAATFLRVLATLVVSSLWTIPMGVWIGLNPRVSRFLQPVIQFAASFPAPMLYPVVLSWILAMGGNLGWGAVVLMMLGAQWYILFNVAAGAQSIPADMVSCADVFRISGWGRWKSFILPAILPFLVTGWITSAGGAWNASIVAEFVQHSGKTYTAFGLGDLISQATGAGQFDVLAAAVLVMALTVVTINRAFWKRLQKFGDQYCRFGG
ncbi:MAG TPA: ABC transporter permease subunit [Terrimicrobiaceae bacterium]